MKKSIDQTVYTLLTILQTSKYLSLFLISVILVAGFGRGFAILMVLHINVKIVMFVILSYCFQKRMVDAALL